MKRSQLLVIALGALVSCGEPSSTRRGAAALEIGGAYHVTGVTISDESGDQRPIQGRVNVTITGDTYTTHFELKTLFPGADRVAAEVIGTGEGTVDDHMLEGTAHLQIVASKVPGVDAGFSMIPQGIGPKVASTSTAEFFDDGSVRIHIRNEADEGETQYESTHTRLVGYRIEDL
ncbi:MAG: hypothetical protein ACQGVK_19375 [Myxococcota bacterium]